MKPLILFLSLTISLIYFTCDSANAQCCSGANPVVGGISVGVLQKNQFEVAGNYQYYESKITMTSDTLAKFSLFEKVYGSYMYYKIGYGLSEKLTVSVEAGYIIKKAEILTGGDELSGKGIGDLIIFPRYNVFSKNTPKHQTDFTLGLGSKIPIGEYDQTYIGFINPTTGDTVRFRKSPGLQPSSGSNDFIFYASFYRGYKISQLRYNLNFTYLMRGTNPVGVVYGDIYNVSLSAGKSFFQKLYLGLELKGESLDTVLDPKYLTTKYNTGGKKLSVAGRISFTLKQKLTFTAFSDFPIFQYVNGTQVASQYLINFGIIYRFAPIKVAEKETDKVKE